MDLFLYACGRENHGIQTSRRDRFSGLADVNVFRVLIRGRCSLNSLLFFCAVHAITIVKHPNAGAIPTELGNLSKLEGLSLASNKLVGEVYTYPCFRTTELPSIPLWSTILRCGSLTERKLRASLTKKCASPRQQGKNVA